MLFLRVDAAVAVTMQQKEWRVVYLYHTHNGKGHIEPLSLYTYVIPTEVNVLFTIHLFTCVALIFP